MANTIKVFRHGYEISGIDSDWDPGEWMDIDSIQFVPGATNDICTIKDQSDTGPVIFYANSTDGDSRIKYFPSNARFKPLLDFSACTLNSGAYVIIILR